MAQARAFRRGFGSIAAAAALTLIAPEVQTLSASPAVQSLPARHEHKGKGHGSSKHSHKDKARRRSETKRARKAAKKSRGAKNPETTVPEMPPINAVLGSVFDLTSL